MKSFMNERHPARIRAGILGCSDIATRKFIPALQRSGMAHLGAIASRQRDKNMVLASEESVTAVTYDELVHDPAIDVIYLSLPNHLHELWSIRALEQGKHVLCEKPLGLTTASVRRMLDAAKANDRLLFENLMYLQHPQHRMVQQLIASGRIGPVRSLHCEFAFPGPADGNFRLDPSMGGGAFHDMNRYPLSAAQFFLQGKRHRFLRGAAQAQNGLNRSFEAVSTTDAGERFSFLTAFGLPYRSFYEITGAHGSIRVERAFTTPAELENSIVVREDGHETLLTVPPCDHFLATIDHVCTLIRSGTWDREHERSKTLAALADMMRGNCPQREV